ncbi:MAG: hypothetical protein ACKO9I_19340 [Sphaerospermopsis kisseleviana]
MELMQERLESVKAGVIGSLSVGSAFLVTTVVNGLLLKQYFPILNIHQGSSIDLQIINLQISQISQISQIINSQINLQINLQFILSAVIAGFSGFLFGVTYRYIIRVDKNSHLKSGAVFAFGLVRGLTQIEFGWSFNNTILPFLILAAESIFWFALAVTLLDLAISLTWLKPFIGNRE